MLYTEKSVMHYYVRFSQIRSHIVEILGDSINISLDSLYFPLELQILQIK